MSHCWTFYCPPKARGSGSEKHCFGDKQACYRQAWLSALPSGPCCSRLHILSLAPLSTQGHWLPPLHSSIHATLSWQFLCLQFIPLDPCHAVCTPPRSAPWQSTAAPGMQNNASLSWILKKTVCVPSERMSCLHCSSITANGFSCQENWPRSSPLSDPSPSSLQIFQADTLAPLIAFRLC